ncbi:hypothetical protein CDQ84_17140 [Clostridium thermosuccinogenes]|uniref:DUF4349 domain-containing protein n=1 Tax=Clostridium thermosuccinogenes TaxID=84032 RepID=A0A2K2F9H9_9CLOT|nr:DUF4349 domain-containing protein [Pseudoclostridium thermosuccinogenes]AUS95562.1 hypothetical protein CDO33_03365 [Pseudoclostridium thermosuccinogenes]PNT94807.1 hypothetical protein CDQ85_17040 [Pseudoclostridium thermosuccinogenes]PNT95435.1 hypothetical protein CDQ84_17140 [Pseudoclostridium thermosuccinogenes]
MLKRVLCLLIAAVLVFSSMAGCGSKSSKKTASSVAYDKSLMSNSKADYNSAGSDGDAGKAENETAEADQAANADSISGAGISTASLSNAILSERKLIRSANVTVEVDDFEKAYGQLKTLINAIGFIQESSIRKDKRYIDSQEVLLTRAVIILRVDKDKFEQVVDGISGLGTLIDQSIYGEDVTDKYFDKEARLRLLRFEESRIEEYLKKLTDLDAIFRVERQLTEIRHEIESLTGTLKKWDNLVELSTITVNMNEKEPEANAGDSKGKSYLTRLKERFEGGIRGLISFCGDVVLFLVGILPTLLLLAVLGLIAYKVYRAFSKKTPKAPADKSSEENTQ